MNLRRLPTLWIALAATILPATSATVPATPASPPLRWLAPTDPRIEIRGLPWLSTNAPESWRLPAAAQATVPAGVWRRAVAPDGGRVRLTTNTSRLVLRLQTMPAQKQPCFVDTALNDEPPLATKVLAPQPAEFVLFEGRDRSTKDITVYLPNNHEIRVLAIGLDVDAPLSPPPAFARAAPLVCYGSSVLQGTGSAHPARTYPAVAARALHLDFVNLGFGGAGKAEPAVVDLIAPLDACAFLFDLGKSYGNQDLAPYARMLDTVRRRHPLVPIICVTPIYSTKEPNEPDYREKSERLRALMRQAALERRAAGDLRIHVIEGLDLFGPADAALFKDPQHPNDAGNELLGRRLASILARILAEKN